MTTQIVPQFINPPKPGKKFGNIKLQDGSRVFVPAHALGYFQPNVGCTIEYTQQKWGDMDAVVVTKVNGNDITGQAPDQFGAVPQGDKVSPPAPPVMGGTKPDHKLPASPEEAENMFVMGVVGRAMGSGQFGSSQIQELTNAAVRAWRARHTSGQPQHPGLDDQIPF